MTILATASLDGFFQGALEEVLKVRRVEASQGARTYLVGVLSEFARPDAHLEATLERPLAFLLDEALHTNDLGERFARLRALGDGVLYSSGFFFDHFERRGVDEAYLVGIGARAYGSAGDLLARGAREEGRAPGLFEELAERFRSLVAVVAEVSNLTLARSADGAKGLLKLYERWLKTGSETLAGALTAHGFHAVRGGRVLS